MKFNFKHILFALALLMLSPSAYAKLQVKVSLDSSQIVMGHVTALRFDLIEPADKPAQLMFDKNAMPPQVEPVDWVYGDTTDLGNGLREMQRALIIQSFDSGTYTLPAFLLVSGPDTVRSNQLALKVLPVDVSKMTDVNPIAPVLEFQSRWYDFLPDWLTEFWGWYLAALLIIAGGICAYLIMTKKVAVNLLPQKKRLPPDVIAVNRLNALRDQGLWEKGQDKEYYTRLTDILREYLAERFGINAMEMTSTQILKTLRENKETHMSKDYMEKILSVADFVKFAKVRPLPDDNVRSFQNALSFVEETKPAPEPPAEDASQTPSGGNQTKTQSPKAPHSPSPSK